MRRGEAPRISFALASEALRDAVFSDESLEALAAMAIVSDDVLSEFHSESSLRALADVDVLVTGWGCPPVTAAVLDAAPQLKLVAHSAGSVKSFLGPETWQRGITVTTADAANARPVAEYTIAMILLSGKKLLAQVADARREQGDRADAVSELRRRTDVGNYGSTVGIVGASLVGRRVLELLRPFDLRVLLYDPTLSSAEAASLGVELVELDELMARSDVVSLHAPVLQTTIGMIGRAQLGRMKDGATLINTARGVLLNHEALRDEVVSGRLSAILDVTSPEPLPTGDVLYFLPNVLITPHSAGSQGNELFLLGESVVDEVQRFVAGLPPAHPLTLDAMTRTA